jgi:PAS domain S-box-containing protein
MPLSTALAENRLIEGVRRVKRNRVAAYSVAAGLVLLATAVRLLIGDRLIQGLPFITYFPAIILAAALGGVRVGAFATLASGAAAWALFFQPDLGPSLTTNALVSMLLFLLLAAINVAIVGLLSLAVERVVAQERNIRTLIDSAPNGILVVDEEGTITMVNPAMESLFGYTRSELVGRKVETLLPDSIAGRHVDLRREYARQPEPRPMGAGRDLSGRRRDGGELPLEIGLAPVARNGKRGVLATVVDITERKRRQDRERLLMGELQHRAQNVFAVVQAIALRSFAENKSTAEAKFDFVHRLRALADSYAMLGDAAWEGAPLAEIFSRELSPFSKRVSVSGCEIPLRPSAARQFALIAHELATNAAKHGALSTADGSIIIEGRREHQDGKELFGFRWREIDGPPVSEPSRSGFGTVVLFEAARGFAHRVALDYKSEGVVYELVVRLDAVEAASTRAACPDSQAEQSVA